MIKTTAVAFVHRLRGEREASRRDSFGKANLLGVSGVFRGQPGLTPKRLMWLFSKLSDTKLRDVALDFLSAADFGWLPRTFERRPQLLAGGSVTFSNGLPQQRNSGSQPSQSQPLVT